MARWFYVYTILLRRCSVNATPQQMPQAEKEVENFLRNVGRSKKERKPVRPHIVEVMEPRCASHPDTRPDSQAGGR